MENRKSGFLTFIFALMPGAGQMYLGMMKKGGVLMALFWGIFALAGVMRLGALTIVEPVVWFYAFFDAMNCRHFSYEERKRLDDKFVGDVSSLLGRDWGGQMKKKHVLVGVLLILIGVYAIFESVLMPVMYEIALFAPWMYSLISSIPSLIVAVAVILLGLKLIKGESGKDKQKDFIEFKGDEDERE